MAYLIDGHNLIGVLPDISLADPNDEAKLVLKLRGFAARVGKKCIVVFDKGIPAGKSSLSNYTVEAVFASPGSNADRIMFERIRAAKDPQHWIVVSGDNAVIDCARLHRMRVYRSVEFAPFLNIAPPLDKDGLPIHGKDAPTSNSPSNRKDKIIMDVHVSAAEVAAWLKIFGDGQPPDVKRKKR